MKKLLALTLALMMIAASASAVTKIEGTTKTDIAISSDFAENAPVEGINPFTGLAATGEALTPIMIILDGDPEAQPHWGINEADILFQVPNAGAGATKMMALYADKFPAQAGGVRSARATIVPVSSCFDAAFGFGGGPELNGAETDPKYVMRRAGMGARGLTYNLLGNNFRERMKGIPEPHNLSAHIEEIHQDLLKKGTEFFVRAFTFAEEARTEGADAAHVDVLYPVANGYDSNSTIRFDYDADLAAYVLTAATGKEYQDRYDPQTIPFANVLVVRSDYFFASSYVGLKNNLSGSGVLEIFQNGKYVRGAWYRASEQDRIIFVDADGQELEMQKGKSFIIVTNAVTNVNIQ